MADASDGFRAETRMAIDAVQEALELARGAIGMAEVTFKGERDLVTAADLAVEDAVRARLNRPVIGEERGGDASDGSAHWLLDPICGTRNFASGIPLYCVNLALVEDDVVTIAVIGDASTGEISVAERGQGAWGLIDGVRRHLIASADTQSIVIEDSHAQGARRELAAEFTAAAIRAARWNLHALNTTLSLPYVAAGRMAAYVLFWTSPVHAAAGTRLAAEAGATVTDIDGKPWTIDCDSVVAAAGPELHHDLLVLASEARSKIRGA